MKQDWQVPSEISLVPSEPIPDRLFLCSAKIKPEVGKALNSAFEAGASLPKDIQATYNEHLIYAYDLGEKGSYWEAGPSADFTEVLYIFSTDSLEEAQELMHNDPFYKERIFHDDLCLEWTIHSPIWRANLTDREKLYNIARDFGVLPKYPPEVKPAIVEIKVDIITPSRLVASIAKMNKESVEKTEQEKESGGSVPAFLIQHSLYRNGPGGTSQIGYDWEGGPSVDYRYDLSIFSVNSIQMAQVL